MAHASLLSLTKKKVNPFHINEVKLSLWRQVIIITLCLYDTFLFQEAQSTLND